MYLGMEKNKTYRLIVSKPGVVRCIGGEFMTFGAGRIVVGTGKSFAEASTWARRSPRFRHFEEERQDKPEPSREEMARRHAINDARIDANMAWRHP